MDRYARKWEAHFKLMLGIHSGLNPRLQVSNYLQSHFFLVLYHLLSISQLIHIALFSTRFSISTAAMAILAGRLSLVLGQVQPVGRCV